MFIQTETTPNPATLKFLPGRTIISSEGIEFKTKMDAEQNNLAKKLFVNENVTGVFIGKDFLTVTKNEGVDWESLKPSILSIILDFFF